MTAVRRLLIILTLTLAASTSSQAQTAPKEQQSATAPVSADTDKDVSNARVLRLSLDDAVKTTIEKNLGVEIQRYDYQMAGEILRGSYGVFDWFATADLEHSSSQSPTITQFQPSGSRSTLANFGLSQFIPTGGTYTVGFNNSRQTTNGGGTFVNPAFRTSLGATLNQPLMRNFGIDVSRRNINIARNTLGINSEAFRFVLINTAQAVELAYLDLVYARKNVDVQKDALFLARDQARITQIRIDVGASAPLDILQPRVSIATTEEQLITAVATVRDAEDRLRQLMHLDPIDWDRPIMPTDPVQYTPVTLDPVQAVTRALDLRPEIREQRLTSETRKITYLYARNQILPKVDLNLSYSAAGLGGRVTDIDPVTGLPTGTTTTKSYPSALNQVFKSDFPSWTVGFNVGIPVMNIGARAEARRAELDYKLSQTTEAQTRENVAVDVRKAVRDVDTAAKQITATRAAREAAEQNLDAERKRYENGMTTNFNVLQIQQQLNDARVNEIQALVGYNKALANYHRAVGDLLEVRNITVDEPAKPDEPKMFTRFDRYNWLNYGSREKNQEPKK